jgi:hypothetical protein
MYETQGLCLVRPVADLPISRPPGSCPDRTSAPAGPHGLPVARCSAAPEFPPVRPAFVVVDEFLPPAGVLAQEFRPYLFKILLPSTEDLLFSPASAVYPPLIHSLMHSLRGCPGAIRQRK